MMLVKEVMALFGKFGESSSLGRNKFVSPLLSSRSGVCGGVDVRPRRVILTDTVFADIDLKSSCQFISENAYMPAQSRRFLLTV